MGSFCCCRKEKNHSEPLLEGYHKLELNPESMMRDSKASTHARSPPKRKLTEDINHLTELTFHPGDFVRQRNSINAVYEQAGEIIGEGTYGRIVKLKHKLTGEMRACKVICKNKILQGFQEEDIINEIDVLKSLEHINIIKIFEFFADESNYYIVTEFCEKGDLFNNLDDLQLDEYKVSVILKQILQAVNYLHSKQIFHGDLKLENILVENLKKFHLNHEDTFYINIKLIDFGCSKIFEANEKYKEIIGTIYYSSPEVLKGEYDEKCDIWSAGVIMYVLLTGQMPFKGDTIDVVKKNILDPSYEVNYNLPELKETCSKDAVDLLKKLLIYDPKKRISASDALNHHWFRNAGVTEDHLVSDHFTKNVLLHLKNHRHEMKFQQAVLMFITHNIGQNEEISKLKLVFKKLDKDNDGKISKDELRMALKIHLGTLAANEVDLIFKEIGAESDGIEYEDFLRVTVHKNRIFNEDNLKAAFDLFDVDGEGSITAEGLKKIMGGERQVADEVIKELLSEIHKNPNENISYKDFMTLMYDKINMGLSRANSIDSYRSDTGGDISIDVENYESLNLLTK